MDLNTDNIRVYEGRSFGDMIRDLENRNDRRKETIEELVDKLTDMVDNPDNAIVLVPLIKEYLEVDTENDKHKVDLMKILQKLYKTKMDADDVNMATDLDESVKNQLKEMAAEEDVEEEVFDEDDDVIESVKDEEENVFEDEELKDLEDRTAEALDELEDEDQQQ